MEFRQTILPPPPTITLATSLVVLWRRAAIVLRRALDGVARFVQRRAVLDTEAPDLGEPWDARESSGSPVEAREGAVTMRDFLGARDRDRIVQRRTQRDGRWSEERDRRTL